jgi:hypothetical protein
VLPFNNGHNWKNKINNAQIVIQVINFKIIIRERFIPDPEFVTKNEEYEQEV